MGTVPFYGVYYQTDTESELCEVDGGVCYEAFRTEAEAQESATRANEMHAYTVNNRSSHGLSTEPCLYVVKPIPAGTMVYDRLTDSVMESGSFNFTTSAIERDLEESKMSAFLVSQNHINAIISYAMDCGMPADSGMTRVLTDENMRSLRARYEDNTDEECLASTYVFERVDVRAIVRAIVRAEFINLRKRFAELAKQYPNNPDLRKRLPSLTESAIATAIVKACDCYDYQACETDDYHSSEAYNFVSLVRLEAQLRGGKLDGNIYHAMPWGL